MTREKLTVNTKSTSCNRIQPGRRVNVWNTTGNKDILGKIGIWSCNKTPKSWCNVHSVQRSWQSLYTDRRFKVLFPKCPDVTANACVLHIKQVLSKQAFYCISEKEKGITVFYTPIQKENSNMCWYIITRKTRNKSLSNEVK